MSAVGLWMGPLLLLAFLVWLYCKQNAPSGKIVGGLLSVVICSLMVYAVWLGFDDKGYIPHSKETSITAESTWLVGESKTCISSPSDKNGDVTRLIYCDKGEEHRIAITFWGKTEREDARARTAVEWKCVKKSDSFVCYALT